MSEFSLLLCAIVMMAVTCLCANTSEVSTKPNAPGRYKILGQSQSPVKIPFWMLDNKPVMEAKINGHPAVLTIDNGILWDEIWLFGTPLVEHLSLENEAGNSIEGAGDGEPTEASLAKNICLSFAGIEFYEQVAYVSPATEGFASAFKGMDGQICNTFFSHFVVEFDFDRMEIILHDPDAFSFTGKGCALDIKREDSGTCSLPAAFTLMSGDTYQGRIDMDLGGVHTVLVALNNQNGIAIPDNAVESKLYGASGEFTVYESTLQELRLGKYVVERPQATFCDEASGRVHPGNLGTVGLPLLMQYNPVFDYHRDLLYLQERE